jgi:hypothetical protein
MKMILHSLYERRHEFGRTQYISALGWLTALALGVAMFAQSFVYTCTS